MTVDSGLSGRPVRLWIGLVLLALGTFGVLGAMDVLDAGALVGTWWPIALVGLGVVPMVAQRRVWTGPVVVTVLGLVLLVDNLGWAGGGLLWPSAVLVVGVIVLWGLRGPRGSRSSFAMFGGATIRERSPHLRHVDTSALFGGTTLDLRQAHIDDEATVDAFALFGGVDVLVPRGWRVSIGGLPLMGGIDDKTTPDDDLPADAPVLVVNGMAMFGAVTVKDRPDEE